MCYVEEDRGPEAPAKRANPSRSWIEEGPPDSGSHPGDRRFRVAARRYVHTNGLCRRGSTHRPLRTTRVRRSAHRAHKTLSDMAVQVHGSSRSSR